MSSVRPPTDAIHASRHSASSGVTPRHDPAIRLRSHCSPTLQGHALRRRNFRDRGFDDRRARSTALASGAAVSCVRRSGLERIDSGPSGWSFCATAAACRWPSSSSPGSMPSPKPAAALPCLEPCKCGPSCFPGFLATSLSIGRMKQPLIFQFFLEQIARFRPNCLKERRKNDTWSPTHSCTKRLRNEPVVSRFGNMIVRRNLPISNVFAANISPC